ncbi:MAG: uroporphyrinogen decarboxylase family protein [Candidatus Humimicrobiaceae bacterium]
MDGRERVKKTIDHIKTDRPACSYEATYEVTAQLIKFFGIDKRKDLKSVSLSGSNQPGTEDNERKFGLQHELELNKILGIDQSIVICPVNPVNTIGNWWGVPLLSRFPDGKILGAWDIIFEEWKYPYGTYIEINRSPLIHASLDEIKSVKLPSLEWWDFDAYTELLKNYKNYFVWMNMNGCFDMARFQRSSEQFFMDLAAEPEKAEILLEKVNDLAISFFEKAISKVKGLVDGVYLGDDFGTQNGLSISPEMWRKFIKPRYKKLVSLIKSHGLKYCHHSCGGIRPIIPDMIEIGFDVLNPIQPLAKGMDPDELGKEFGKDIAFYGGIDEQKTLPFGTVEDVKKEVLHRIETLGKYNGYIVAPAHAFQPDSPIENILAVYETVLGTKFAK